MAKILVQYEADTSKLQEKLKSVEQSNLKLGATAKSTGDKMSSAFNSASNTLDGAGKSTNKFTETIKGLGDKLSSTNNIFAEIGSGIAAAFTIDLVLRFASETVKAFQEAELNARKLQSAVGVNGGVSEDFERLISQSEDLQKITIFSNADIQKAQTAALQYGLTADQVERLIPVITDFASATGQDLDSALQSVILGLEGNARGLKKYGVQVDATLDSTGKLADITDQLSKKYKDQAVIVGETAYGATKKLSNQFEGIKENIGSFVSGIEEIGVSLLSLALNGFKPLDDELDNTGEKLLDTTEKVKKFNLAILSANITNLEQQIKAGTGESQKLNEELDKLKEKKLSIEISGLSDSQILERIAAIEKFKFRFKEDDRELKALQKESEKRRLDSIVSEKDLTKLTESELLKRQQILKEANKNTNNKSLSDALEAIQNELDARKAGNDKALQDRQKASEQLKQIALKDAQDLLQVQQTTEAERLAKERDGLIQERQLLYESGLKRKTDEETLQNDIANIKEKYRLKILDAEKAAKQKRLDEIDKINKKNADDDLKATLAAIDLSASEETKRVIEEYIKKADFSEKAQKGLAQKLLKIEVDFAIAKDKEIIKNSQSTDEQILAAKKDLADQEAKLAKGTTDNYSNEDQKRLDSALSIVSGIEEAYTALFGLISALNQQSISAAESNRDSELQSYDDQLSSLEKLNERKAISDREYERRKSALLESRTKAEKKANDEIKKLKQEQAENDKLKAIFDTIINTAVAVTKFLASGNIALSIIAGATGALELATIISTPIPKFYEGEKFVKRGKNKPGRDTIPAMLNEGERVVTTEKNKKYWDLYEAIDGGKLDRYIEERHVLPKLLKLKKQSEEQRQKSFAESVAASLLTVNGGITGYEMNRIFSKGIHIKNADEVGKHMAKEIVSNMPKSYGGWG